MAAQNPLFDLKAFFTGLAQTAAIATFVLVLSMYVNQSLMDEKQKDMAKDLDKLEQRVTDLEYIIPDRVKVKPDKRR